MTGATSIAVCLLSSLIPTSTPSPAPTPPAGGLSFAIGDTEVRFQPLGVLQVDGRFLAHDNHRAVEGDHGFVVPRARLGGRLQSEWLSLQILVEGAREKTGLLEAFGTVHLGDDESVVDVAAGLTRSPLLLGGPEPLVLMPLNERSALERTLWPGRELGVGVHVAPSSLPVEAWARVSNGNANALLGNDNAGLAADARVDLAWGAARRRKSAVGLGLRLGLSARVEDTDNEAGRDGTTPLGFQYWRPPPVSGPSALAAIHVVGVFGTTRLALQGGLTRESRASDDDGNPDTAKLPQSGVMHAGGSAELSTTVWGPPRAPGVAAASSSPGDPTVEVAVRAERLWLGLTPPGEESDPLVSASGATVGSAAVTAWLSSWTSVSAQTHVVGYDVAPLEDPDRTISVILQLRWTLVVM